MSEPVDPYLDPDAPDLAGTAPDRYLSGVGFAYRLLRLIERDKREDISSQATLWTVRKRCLDLVATQWPPREEEGTGGHDA